MILLRGACLLAGTEGLWRFYPLPITEAEEVLSRWLSDSGFRVTRAPAEGGQIRVMGVKGNETWQVMVEPRSALASQILVEYTVSGQPDRSKTEELWASLENYITGASPEGRGLKQAIPIAVFSQRESVVCVRAKAGNELIQSTGFFIDPKGLILTTAHDFSEIRDVTVTLDNGHGVEGRLVKIDSRRDLALIDITLNFSSSVAFIRARDVARIGERIYSVTCSSARQREFHIGIIDGPMRLANDLPLLQVRMETLPGSSGSPVFDVEGNLLGVVKGRYRGTDSVGFLIPPETVREFLGTK
jgi:serine protease Do